MGDIQRGEKGESEVTRLHSPHKESYLGIFSRV